MNIPEAVSELARDVVCRALSKWTRRRGVLGNLLRQVERVACDASASASRDAYQRGWNDCNLASISALARSER